MKHVNIINPFYYKEGLTASVSPLSLCVLFISLFLLRFDFRLHFRNQHRELGFTFFPCLCVDITRDTLAVGVGRREPPLVEVVVFHGDATCAGLAYLALVRLKF